MAYKYSKIIGIEIEDFRNLGHVYIDFTQSNIICLKGGNEAGKSSVVLAMKSLGSMLNTKQYKEYIRTGTEAWKVMIYTADGKAVYRTKSAKGQSYGIYQIRTIDGKEHYDLEWSIDKLDENAVPKEVQDILGLETEPETGELLNIRTYEDKMLFVETSGGANYKVMYNALKIDNLSKAVKYGTKEVKKYQGEIDKFTTAIDTCKEEIGKVQLIDTESLYKMRDRITEEKAVAEKAQDAIDIGAEVRREEEVQETYQKIKQLELLDEYEYGTVQKATGLLNEIKGTMRLMPFMLGTMELEEIDGGILDKCQKALQFKQDLSQANYTELYKTLSIGTISSEEQSIMDKVLRAIKVKNELMSENKPALMETKGLETLSPEEYVKVRQAIKLLNECREASMPSFDAIMGLVQIDGSVLEKIVKARKICSEIADEQAKITTIANGVQQFYGQLKAMKIDYEICPNCGELILPDSTHMHESGSQV